MSLHTLKRGWSCYILFGGWRILSWERDSNNYWGGRGRSEAPSDHLAEVLSEEGARGVGYHIIITIIFLNEYWEGSNQSLST